MKVFKEEQHESQKRLDKFISGKTIDEESDAEAEAAMLEFAVSSQIVNL